MKKISILLTLLCLLTVSFNAQRTITGLITDQAGDPLPGVSVLAKGTSVGTMTKLDGTYSINVSPYVNVLIFSFIGMKTIEKEIEHDVINVIMLPDESELEEVVVESLGVVVDKKSEEYSDRPKFHPSRSVSSDVRGESSKTDIAYDYSVVSDGEYDEFCSSCTSLTSL